MILLNWNNLDTMRIVLYIFSFFLISACRGSHTGTACSTGDKKVFDLEFFYSTPCSEISPNSVSGDTLFKYALDFPADTAVRTLVYVGSGDCSVCIAAMLDFLKTYSELKNDISLFLLLKAESRELLDYYISTDSADFCKDNISRIKNLKVILAQPEIKVDDGMYLLAGDKIVRYSAWKI